MYVLRNATGNVVRHTDSERKRDALLRQGYVEVPDVIKGATPYIPKKRQATKKTDKEAEV